MKIFIAPLNWGLGHAARCIPLIDRFLAEGHEVVLGGDGLSLLYLKQRYPYLRSIPLAPLDLRYSAGKRQVLAMLVAIPKIIQFSIRDYRLLQSIQQEEKFDQIISDNRFGLWCSVNSVYITHQLHIHLPYPYRWLEPLAARLHAWVYKHYTEVWIPDTPDHRLSGDLSTGIACLTSSKSQHSSVTIKYIGVLSRFANVSLPSIPLRSYKVVALYSGLEPQRTLLENDILARFKGQEEDLLLVNGKQENPLSDSELAYYLIHAEKIIARSGYSTIMDLETLGVLDKAELIPTPGQPEQEYLARRICKS